MEMISSAAAAGSREVIPGLPNDVGMQCLLKVPRMYHACLASVCVAWRNAVRHPEFYRQRRRLGIADPWLVIISTEIGMAPALLYSAYDLSTKSLLFKVRFPPSVGAVRRGLRQQRDAERKSIGFNYPHHYRIAAMNEFFTVLGFNWHSRSAAPRCSLTIYNTVTDEWRQGAPLPVWREMFACGVIGTRLYVAGGVNAKGETERVTEGYDFLTDRWCTVAPLPACVRRVEADAVFQGRLHVQSSCTAEGRCFWSYDPQRGTWQLERGPPLAAQQLLATDNFLYAICSPDDIFRFDPRCSLWIPAGRRIPPRICSLRDKCRPTMAVCNFHTSQKVFGHGNDIFFINDSSDRACGLLSDGVTRCHRLLSVKPTWYHAGAIVSA